jgi:hypothetical protein
MIGGAEAAATIIAMMVVVQSIMTRAIERAPDCVDGGDGHDHRGDHVNDHCHGRRP